MSSYVEKVDFEPFREEMANFVKIASNMENIEMIRQLQNTLDNQKLIYEDKSAQLEDRYEKLKAHFFGMQE